LDRSFEGDFVSQVVACPNCDKKLAVKNELVGRVLVCPQCKGRFTVPADEPVDDRLGVATREAPASTGSEMDFLDGLTPAPVRTASNTSPRGLRLESSPAVSLASRMATTRARGRKNQMTVIYIGGGIAAAVLVAILIAVAMQSADRGARREKAVENIRFGLTDSNRHQLFGKLMLAVDQYRITKECKEEWFRLADEYKLDRQHIRDILDEGFSRKDWDQPAPTHVTNENRGTRMEWIAKRAHGGDPILAL
jgi:hypothetical protein